MAILQCLLLVAGLGMAAAQPAGAPNAANAFHLQDISSGTCMDTINGQLTVAVGCNVQSTSKVRSVLHKPFTKRPAVDDRCLPCGRPASIKSMEPGVQVFQLGADGSLAQSVSGLCVTPVNYSEPYGGQPIALIWHEFTLVPCRLLRSSLHRHQCHSEHREQRAQSLLTATSANY